MVAIAISLAGSATMFAQSNTTDKGVVINGVTWATRNVDSPGTFAAKPESAGKFYQWNRKKAYSATTPAEGIPIKDWNITNPEGAEWEKENDPSPEGWRVPTRTEFESLLDKDKVRQEWNATKKGITFTDIESGASIFLPAAGYRSGIDRLMPYDKSYGKLIVTDANCYWSGTLKAEDSFGTGSKTAYYLQFFFNIYSEQIDNTVWYNDVTAAYPLRPVMITE